MNILFVTNNYKPYSGGVVSSIDALSCELRKQGHTVYIVTLSFTVQEQEEKDVTRIVCPLKFFYRNNPIGVPVFMAWQVGNIIDQFKPDVVHTHHPFLLGAAAQKVCAQKKIPLVFTHHSQYGTYATHYAPFFKQFARYCIEKKVKYFCKRVSAIIAPSKTIQKELTAHNIKVPVVVLPSGLLSCFMYAEQPKKIAKKKFQLLTVSRFVTEKNIPFLLRVMSKLNDDYSLTLLGFGAHYEALKLYAYNTLKISPKKVIFKNRPTKQEIADWYVKANLFIFASTSETQGLVCAESMAAGTPVVAVNGPGVNECVQNGENGFLVTTEHEMVQKIIQIKKDKRLYNKLSSGAWKTAQNYSIESITKQVINLYKMV